MSIAGLHSAFLDFTVWDNDGLYALVTIVSIAFALALIVMVMRKSREHDAANHSKTASALNHSRTAPASATEQPVSTAPTMTESQPQATPPSTQHGR